jgi:hypothetical protein
MNAPVCSVAKVRIQREQASGKLLTESLAVGMSWSVEDCIAPIPELSASYDGVLIHAETAANLQWTSQLLWWLEGQNILVWENGLDYMWDYRLGWWVSERGHRSPHWGPDNHPGRPLNRGPVRLCSAIPATSTKTYVFFCLPISRVYPTSKFSMFILHAQIRL